MRPDDDEKSKVDARETVALAEDDDNTEAVLKLIERPIFHAESRNFHEVTCIAGHEHKIVCQGRGRDFQVLAAHTDSLRPQFLELLLAGEVERHDRYGTEESNKFEELLVRADASVSCASARKYGKTTAKHLFDSDHTGSDTSWLSRLQFVPQPRESALVETDMVRVEQPLERGRHQDLARSIS